MLVVCSRPMHFPRMPFPTTGRTPCRQRHHRRLCRQDGRHPQQGGNITLWHITHSRITHQETKNYGGRAANTLTAKRRARDNPAQNSKDGGVRSSSLWKHKQANIRGGGITLFGGKTNGGNLGPNGYRHHEQIHKNVRGGRGATYGA